MSEEPFFHTLAQIGIDYNKLFSLYAKQKEKSFVSMGCLYYYCCILSHDIAIANG